MMLKFIKNEIFIKSFTDNKYRISSFTNSFFNIRHYSDINNKENASFLWFDSNTELHQNPEQSKQQLDLINNYLKSHIDLQQFVMFIQSKHKEKLFLITSGSQSLPNISSFRELNSIFTTYLKTNNYKNLINEYSKLISIYADLNELCQSIQRPINFIDKQLQIFNFFDQHQTWTKDLSQQSGEFLWFQLFNYVISRFPRNQQAKQQMIDICKHYYRRNMKELEFINQFDREYRSEDALRWYSKRSFIFKSICKALRNQDIDLMYSLRFFLGDFNEILRNEHEKILSSGEEILTVYRGAKLDREEFQQLKENQGKFISSHGYLSTSRLRSLALAFAIKPTNRTDVVSVLYEIQCNIKQIGKSITFADVAHFSEYPNGEVLFDINACFQIESIEQTETMYLIKMQLSNKGEIITKSYIDEIQKEIEEKSVGIAFGRLLCDSGQYDKSEKYFRQLLNEPNGEDIAWIEFNIGRALYFKGEMRKSKEYYDRAYERMMKSQPPRIKHSAHVLNNIGNILHTQGKYDEAMNYHQRALEIRNKYYPPGNVNIARSLNNIGLILFGQGKFDEALGYYQQALIMLEKYFSSDHANIAHSLNNIGACYESQKEPEMALDYYKRALNIYEKCFPVGHPSQFRTERKIRRLTETN